MTVDEIHAADWEAQYELLSAYADGELEAPASATLEAHLATCARCQAALADLRALKAMLNVMQSPPLERSFAIPEDTPAMRQPARVVRGQPSPHQGIRLARAVEWLGGIAAAAGVALLLGTALLHSPAGSTSTASAPSFGAAASRSPATATYPSARGTAGPQGAQFPGNASAAPDGNPTTTTVGPTPSDGNHAAPISEGETEGAQLPIVPITGAALIIAGGSAFVVGRRADRRGREGEA